MEYDFSIIWMWFAAHSNRHGLVIKGVYLRLTKIDLIRNCCTWRCTKDFSRAIKKELKKIPKIQKKSLFSIHPSFSKKVQSWNKFFEIFSWWGSRSSGQLHILLSFFSLLLLEHQRCCSSASINTNYSQNIY